jgi:hypothetical protein
VALEVVKEGVKEGGPVGLEAVHLEVAQREGEAVAKVGISPLMVSPTFATSKRPVGASDANER